MGANLSWLRDKKDCGSACCCLLLNMWVCLLLPACLIDGWVPSASSQYQSSTSAKSSRI